MIVPPNEDIPDHTPKVYIYILQIIAEYISDMSPDAIKNRIQSYIGPDHEVLSVKKGRLNRCSNSNILVMETVVAIRTRLPTYVASILIGNNWEKIVPIIFKGGHRPSCS